LEPPTKKGPTPFLTPPNGERASSLAGARTLERAVLLSREYHESVSKVFKRGCAPLNIFLSGGERGWEHY
jgi:hypothetical protein